MASDLPPVPDVSMLLRLQQVQTRKFVLATTMVVSLIAFLALTLAWRQGVFDRHLVFRFATPSGQNLSRGMAVVFKGFKVGHLAALELLPDGRIVGEVNIKEKHAAFLTQGAALRLSKDKIVTSELVLEPGAPGGALLASGTELGLKTDGGMDAFEKRIMDRVDPVLAELTQLIKRLGDPQHGAPSAVEALRVTLLQANATLQQVNTTLATANKTFTDLDGRIKDPKLDGILHNAEQTLAGLKSNTEQIDKTLASSQQLMDSGQQLLSTSQQDLKGTNAELAVTLKATQRVLNETVALMEDMRGSTLGRWLVGPRKAASSPAATPTP